MRIAATTRQVATAARGKELILVNTAAQRMLAAHDDLTYLVADFARGVTAARPDRDRLEDLYAAALLQSSHAARWAQRLAWTAKQDYTVTARQVPVVLVWPRPRPGSSRWRSRWAATGSRTPSPRTSPEPVGISLG